MPANVFAEILHPRNLDQRNEWDRTFVDHEILKTYPDDKGYITFMRTLKSWPLSDRTFVLFNAPAKKIDWFGKQALLLVLKNAWHQSKPDGVGGHVKATNGGNFYVVIPDEADPNVVKRCQARNLCSKREPCLPCRLLKNTYSKKYLAKCRLGLRFYPNPYPYPEPRFLSGTR